MGAGTDTTCPVLALSSQQKKTAEEYIKIHMESDLKLTLRVELSSEKGISEQRIVEIKAALRELGMDDNVCLSERNRPDDDA